MPCLKPVPLVRSIDIFSRDLLLELWSLWDFPGIVAWDTRTASYVSGLMSRTHGFWFGIKNSWLLASKETFGRLSCLAEQLTSHGPVTSFCQRFPHFSNFCRLFGLVIFYNECPFLTHLSLMRKELQLLLFKLGKLRSSQHLEDNGSDCKTLERPFLAQSKLLT